MGKLSAKVLTQFWYLMGHIRYDTQMYVKTFELQKCREVIHTVNIKCRKVSNRSTEKMKVKRIENMSPSVASKIGKTIQMTIDISGKLTTPSKSSPHPAIRMEGSIKNRESGGLKGVIKKKYNYPISRQSDPDRSDQPNRRSTITSFFKPSTNL